MSYVIHSLHWNQLKQKMCHFHHKVDFHTGLHFMPSLSVFHLSLSLSRLFTLGQDKSGVGGGSSWWELMQWGSKCCSKTLLSQWVLNHIQPKTSIYVSYEYKIHTHTPFITIVYSYVCVLCSDPYPYISDLWRMFYALGCVCVCWSCPWALMKVLSLLNGAEEISHSTTTVCRATLRVWAQLWPSSLHGKHKRIRGEREKQGV